jgi:hypothetical protein
MSNGGDGAQQTFRINGTLMIKMVVAEKVQINLREDINACILGITVAENEDGSIYNKEADDYRDRVFVVTEESKE